MKNIYLLPTDQQSRIHKNDKGELVLCDLYFGKNTINGHHLYITYNEYIERGDKGWLLEDSSNVVNVTEFDCTNGLGGIYPTDRKIVLTTDPILIKDGVQEVDEDFLKTYVKNPVCTFVDINKEFKDEDMEYETCINHYIDGCKDCYRDYLIYKLKYDDSNGRTS